MRQEGQNPGRVELVGSRFRREAGKASGAGVAQRDAG
jgi:hypothetical protein